MFNDKAAKSFFIKGGAYYGRLAELNICINVLKDITKNPIDCVIEPFFPDIIPNIEKVKLNTQKKDLQCLK